MGFENALARLVNGRLLTDDPPPQFSAMVGLDLRSFKSINDRFGHVGGDVVLKAVVSRLLDAAAPLDLVARQGGDMFTVFVHDAGGPAEVERLRAGFEGVFAAPFSQEGEPVRLSASIGFSIVGAAEFEVPALMAAADAALFAARHRRT
jgi:diguanylate cyclase (GGDEF)-like protein